MSSFTDSNTNNTNNINENTNVQCKPLETDPNEILGECEKCIDEMKTSLKPYHRHFILCLPQGIHSFLDVPVDLDLDLNDVKNNDKSIKNWPSHIEEIPIVKLFNDIKNKYDNDSIKLKLTACDYNPNPDPNLNLNLTGIVNEVDTIYNRSISIIIYPENVIITIPYNSISMDSGISNQHIENLFKWCYSNQPSTSTTTTSITTSTGVTSLRGLYLESNVVITDTPWDKLILVCTHMSRDKRCGRAGPLIMSELQKQLTNLAADSTESTLSTVSCTTTNTTTSTTTAKCANIQICGSSHIGGHKYAGVLIVYPDNQWYGRISKATITKLLNVLLKRDMNVFMEKCHRGSGYCSNNKSVSELF